MLVLFQGEVSALCPLSFSPGADTIPDAGMVKIATFRTIPQSWLADNGNVGYGSVSSFLSSLALALFPFPASVLFPVCSRLSCLVLLLPRWQQDSRSFA